ncbi:unnamed protein product [Boreogadus saida]
METRCVCNANPGVHTHTHVSKWIIFLELLFKQLSIDYIIRGYFAILQALKMNVKGYWKGISPLAPGSPLLEHFLTG